MADTIPLNVLILVGRFDVGGIQRQVMTTAAGLAHRGHRVRVLAIYPTGRFAVELRAAGIDVRSLDRRSRRDVLALLRGVGQVRAFAPDVLYCYHVLPNLVGALYRALSPGTRLVWGIRATDLHKHGLVKRTQFKASRYVSRVPDAIIANSDAVRDFHVRAGYPAGAVRVIPNGIDTERFRPDPERRASARAALGLADRECAVGVVAQLRGKKGHRTLLEALPSVLAEDEDAVVLMVGDGPERERLEVQAAALGIDGRVRWLGYREDMPALYNALDLLCLPSTFGEGFPNVIGEALACGVPVVATDVGGSGQVIGPHGALAAPADPEDLARALRWAARQRASGALAWPVTAAAERIDREFSTGALLDRTEELLREATAGGRGGRAGGWRERAGGGRGGGVIRRASRRAAPRARGPAPASGGVVYIASIDLSDDTGPAVNEREGLLALRRLLGSQLSVLVGEPRKPSPDLDEIRPDRLLPRTAVRAPWELVAHQVAKARILRREVRRTRPACVVARLDVLPLGLLLGTLGTPAQLVLKTVSTSTLRLDPAQHGRAPAAAHRLAVRALARKVTAADTITERRRPIVAAELGLPPARVAVIDNGVNVRRFHPIEQSVARERCGIDCEAVVFGYAGAQAWTRGGRHLIDSAKRLKAEFARPRIVIVGGGESIDRLAEHARSLGHDDICEFPGLVPYDDVVWWMNCFDVAVSIETGSRAQREGHAQQKVRQYTAVGLPVVSATGGNEYLERHGLGSLVDPDDPEAVAEALVEWGSMEGVKRGSVRERAREFAEARLTVEALAEERVAFWDRIGARETEGPS